MWAAVWGRELKAREGDYVRLCAWEMKAGDGPHMWGSKPSLGCTVRWPNEESSYWACCGCCKAWQATAGLVYWWP